MEATLKDLITKRGRVKASLTRFKTACTITNVSAAVLEERLRLNSGLYQQFTELQDRIEDLIQGTDDEAMQIQERESFETMYCEVFASVRERIASFNPEGFRMTSAMNTPSTTATPNRLETQVKLPTIALPSFDGSYGDWVRFRDSFQSLIHENENLSNIQKFYYLNSALKGDAARIIKSLGVSNANYTLAWESIRSRYEDSRALIHHHTKTLLRLPTITKRTICGLRQFTDDFNNQILALKALKKDVENCDWLITFLMTEKLDSITKSEWDRKLLTLTDEPTLKDFSDFLNDQCRYLELSGSLRNVTISNPVPAPIMKTYRGTTNLNVSHVANVQATCILCKGKHFVQSCESLHRLTPTERVTEIQKLRACFNCLRTGHGNKLCSRGTCRKCGKKHHTLLHIDAPLPTQQSAVPKDASDPITQSQALTSTQSVDNTNVVLSTALLYIEDSHGKKHECRALLDSGSQSHFITENFSRKLGLPRIPVETTVSGIGRTSSDIKYKNSVKLSSRFSAFKTTIACLLIEQITDEMPNVPINSASLQIPKHFVLADPHYARPGRIDLLIGAGLFWNILCVGQHKLGPEYPLLQKTQFGWIIAGAIKGPEDHSSSKSRTHLVTNEVLQDELSKFWELEQIPPTRTLNKITREFCEEYFLNTTTRDSTGRFIVSIPFKTDLCKLGESRDIAERRLLSLEGKLQKHPSLKQEYFHFMKEYVELGHATEIKFSSEREDLINGYYLPHHAVTKETSTTTKLRVVFDGSAKTSSGLSLNEVQHVGPTVQNDLFSILLRFRRHRFVISADIEKMYRQILVKPSDRNYQRILWRFDISEPIKAYELNTVTYGTASAPFLATRTLRKLGEENQLHFPLASRTIINDFYVDDLLTGAETVQGVIDLRHEISMILKQGGFSLRKWASNDSRILMTDTGSTEHKITEIDHDPKTLGLLWTSDKDVLRYSVKVSDNSKTTKRTILSATAQIFDPLGLIGPVTIQAKLILQRLWQLKISWDESLPQDLHSHWRTFRSSLTSLNNLWIPRCTVGQNFETLELHGFCDASEAAYGACIYIRCHCGGDIFCTQLLCAKSRVAPLKTISLPRLELCGALLLAQLSAKVKESVQLDFDIEQYWCDSTVTLAWIKSPPSRWKTFVANRTSEIQTLTNENWNYVPSSDNPADLISRGLSPSALERANLWWHGPSWFAQPEHLWPSRQVLEPTDLPETKQQQKILTVTKTDDFNIFSRYSSFTKLIRIIAYCFRFYYNARYKYFARNTEKQDEPRRYGPLTADELNRSEISLAKLTQRQAFKSELDTLLQDRTIATSSSLISLQPFLDSIGLIRVGGRLKNAFISYKQKHPVILPAKHLFTNLLIKYEHARLMHAGCNAVIASIRTRYWPLSCRNTVRGLLRKCVPCFRARPVGTNYIMGSLPASRLTPARPFFICGVDYAGPFFTKERTRSRISLKAYLCLFVCFTTKAVHLELATDLSTEAFLNCLRRFISRRGRCKDIYSDNGTNFLGARNALNELGALITNTDHIKQVSEFSAKEGMRWHFIPPHAPHFGGLWESAVKSAKFHLMRVIGDTRLTFEELYTVLSQVEACLNSRPLSPLSTDPTDLNPLTPGHFLIGDLLTAFPQRDLTDVPQNRLSRYQLLSQMFQHFWKRWQREYLHQLQQRNKWQLTRPTNFQVGSLVVLKDDNLPPLRWKLGRLTDLHPGADGVTRVVSVRVSDGIVKRPVAKICILPFDADVTIQPPAVQSSDSETRDN